MNTMQLALLFCTGFLSYDVKGYPTSATTCAAAGYTNGCCTGSNCKVAGGNCYCDESCHLFSDCCSDINTIQCYDTPRTCQNSSLDPGCCSLSYSSCYVAAGTCYCDPSCVNYGDCCIDVVNTQCTSRARAEEENLRELKAKLMRAGQRRGSKMFEAKAAKSSSDAAVYRAAVANRLHNTRA